MNLGGWGLANPAGLLWGLSALGILALHILKPRRIRQTVASVFLWRQVEKPVTAASPWQRLIPSWLLAAQILTALAIALAVAQPVRITDEPLAEHTIFVLDASGSMQASDGIPSRLDAAIDRISQLREQVPVNGEVSLVVAGSRARALLTHSGDRGALEEALGRVEPTAGEGDFAGAFAIAAGLDTGERPSRVVLVSDGGVSAADLTVAPVGTRYERIGITDVNRGITQFSVQPTASGLIGRITVAHFGGPPSTQTLRVDVDGITVDRREVTLSAGDVINESVALPNGELIEAFLESEDALDLDDRAVATVARRPEISVLVVGPDNAFLQAALAASPGITVQTAAQFPEAESGTDNPDNPDNPVLDVDVIIADGVNVPAGVAIPVLAIAPPAGAGPITVIGSAQQPALTLVRSDVGLVRDLDLSEVFIAEAQRIEVPAEAEVILGAAGVPLLVTVEASNARLAYLSFAVGDSTLPLQAAFPVLIDRIVTDLAQAITPPARLTIGADLPIDPRLSVVVGAPDGTTLELPAGSAIPEANQIGFWTVTQEGRAPITVAVNGARQESTVAPAPELPFRQAFEGRGEVESRGELPVLLPVLIVALMLLLAEWLLARRRVGVTKKQWRFSEVLRLAVALALLLTIIRPTFTRSSNQVATLFLVDASDSMGAGGRASAAEAVRAALLDRPEGDRAGVVVFGRDARLETLVDDDPLFSQITVQVDSSGTDLAAAMRLGVAGLPSDARRRLVLISDGRATSGDVRDEAERLEAQGVPVDVLVIDPPSGNDLAVAGVEVPSLAHNGEAIAVKVRLFAAAATQAEVILRRETEVIESRVVELNAGENLVVFSDVANDSGVMRYQVEVDSAGDVVRANDVGFAAVPVVGAERVLMIAGQPDSPGVKGLTAILDAAGIDNDTTSVSRVPAIDELTRYAAIVMVDVDRRDLSDGQVAALSGAVRDLGRGLVVIGGTHSFAFGGYRDSDLEELLPVISEITDPLRRQTVAEVLAIDTSGSMGACHCDEEGNNGLGGGNRIGGGISKTAIARNAASRAIAALSATDEVGVLSMDAADRWVIDLQTRPDQGVVDAGLSEVVPDGPTFLGTGLETAAAELRQSSASLKHIIFFSDGFTEPGLLFDLRDQAAALFEEGITVSVVATGEGAAEELRPIAEAGGGRFYPGRNLEQIPDLIVQEAVLASRDFINEGEFSPIVTSSSAVVRNLTASPPLLGYIATTAKATARVDLRIGPDEDPLLASWQVGLGRVSAWMSDDGQRWAAPWSSWEQAPDFWAGVIKDTFPTGTDGGAITTTVRDGRLLVQLEGESDWADDAQATARVAAPDGSGIDVVLERLDGSTFAAEVAIDDAGTYAIGASIAADGETVWSGVGLTSRSYPAEYEPRPVAQDELARLASSTKGRVNPDLDSLFDPEGTLAGSKTVDLTRWLLLFAALAWPLAVALSRLAWRPGVLAIGKKRASSTVDQLRHSLPKMAEPQPRSGSAPFIAKGSATTKSGMPAPPDPASEPDPASKPEAASTLDQLLKKKRDNPKR